MSKKVSLAAPEASGLKGLPGLLDVPEEARDPAFLLAPGASGGIDSAGLATLCKGLAVMGHPAIRFELAYAAAGRSSPPKAERSVGDWAAALESARVLLKGSRKVVVGGKSYGGRVASMAVAEGLPADGLLFYGYPLHAPNKTDKPRVEHFPKIDVPCLFLQGTKDSLCDLRLLEKFLPRIPGKATLHVVEGADHSLAVGRKQPASQTMIELAPVIAAWAASSFR